MDDVKLDFCRLSRYSCTLLDIAIHVLSPTMVFRFHEHTHTHTTLVSLSFRMDDTCQLSMLLVHILLRIPIVAKKRQLGLTQSGDNVTYTSMVCLFSPPQQFNPTSMAATSFFQTMHLYLKQSISFFCQHLCGLSFEFQCTHSLASSYIIVDYDYGNLFWLHAKKCTQ